MGPIAALNHLLNFVAPAVFVGGALCLVGSRLHPRQGLPWAAQWALNSVAGLAVLIGMLMTTGADARMASYALLVLVSATTQGLGQRIWRA